MEERLVDFPVKVFPVSVGGSIGSAIPFADCLQVSANKVSVIKDCEMHTRSAVGGGKCNSGICYFFTIIWVQYICFIF